MGKARRIGNRKSGASAYLLKKGMRMTSSNSSIKSSREPPGLFLPDWPPKLLEEFARNNPKGPIPSKNSGKNSESTSGEVLNGRQIEVLRLVAGGLSYKEVGSRLFLSERTIKYHMAEIMHRLHLENRSQVMAFAVRMGAQVLAFAGRIGLTAYKPNK